MHYRREIDGLRALAVVPVILFHAGFGFVRGGFVGVDVFFVISGYLITGIILADLASGRFSIARFYERRARRILPALFLVMAASLPFAWWWLLPSDLKEFAQSLIAIPLFVSNILFLRKSGYFDTAAELKPMLHTWSLAVEEQFYLLFPLLLMLAWRLRRNWLLALLLGIALASLAGAQWGTLHHPMASFFLLPTRAWELAMGASIACYRQHRGDPTNAPATAPWVTQAASLAGLILILSSTLSYSEATPFPGLYALAPTAGAALVILHASPRTLVGRLLGSRPFVAVGLVSYSAYLWHQPVFALARQGASAPLGPIPMAALSLLSLGLAFLSWRLVERPFRQPGVVSQPRLLAFALAGSLLFIALGWAGTASNGFEYRIVLPQAVQDSFARTGRTGECFDKPLVQSRPDWLCRLGGSDHAPDFMLVGDSHAAALLGAFDAAARATGRSGVFTGAGGCPPLLGIHALRADQDERNCHALNERVFAYVRSHAIGTLVLTGRWSYYTDDGTSSRDVSYLGRSPSDPRNQTTSRQAFSYGLAQTVERYAALGVRLVLIEQVPQQAYDPQKVYRRVWASGALDQALLDRFEATRAQHLQQQSFVDGVFARLPPQVQRVDPTDIYCPGERCLMGDAGGSFYADASHLSAHGANRLRARIQALLAP